MSKAEIQAASSPISDGFKRRYRKRIKFVGLASSAVLFLTGSAAAQQVIASNQPIETVIVEVPLAGIGVDPDKVPGDVESLSVESLTRNRQTDTLPNALASRLSSISLNDEQGSQFQPDFVYRGFEASPISGTAQGMAVYQNGVRLNESFGDTVNWDLIPEFAINRITVQSNNPAFGLNAIGGAVTLTMKDGFGFQGADAQLSGGSFGNMNGNGEYGAQFGKFAVYLGVGGTHDDGFRYRSPTTLRQVYGDIGYQDGPLDLHFSTSAAVNDIAAVGPTPVQMLARNRRAVFTYPQAMHNEMELAQVRGLYRADESLSVSFSAYYRHFHQNLTDGNTTDVEYCDNDSAQLCLEGNNEYPADALYGRNGAPVPASVLSAGTTPGETDFSHTDTNTVGGAVQLSLSSQFLGHHNTLVAGASVDHGLTHYTAYGELGDLLDNLQVRGVGVTIDQSASPTAQPPIVTPVDVDARNTYVGIYAVNVLDLTPRLTWTVSARLNVAHVVLNDRLGTSLNGNHGFTRFNPGTGLTYKFSEGLTGYVGYSQSNRAPTTGELSCADPASPCLLDAFLVSDPKLKQIVSRNIEFGLRGKFAVPDLPGRFVWKAGFYRTDVDRDILLLATEINGFGYFQNAGLTRRQGADLHLGYRGRRWQVDASYSYLDATFQNAEVLSSNSPAADADGLIYVHPGDRLPTNPAHRITLAADYAMSSSWSLGADLRFQSGQYLAGDESNQDAKLPGYTTVGIHTAYAIGSRITIFGEVQNLLNSHHYSYGAFTELDGLPPSVNLTNPRTYSPAPGRMFFAGIRASLD